MKTSYSPNFCDSSPPVNLLKMMTANLGLFDVPSISSLFVAFSKIALFPTSFFLLVTPGDILTASRRPRLWYLVSITSGGILSSPPPPSVYRGQGAAYFFFGRSLEIDVDGVCLLFDVHHPNHSVYSPPPSQCFSLPSTSYTSYPTRPLSLSVFSLSIFLRPRSVSPSRSSCALQLSIPGAAFRSVVSLRSNQGGAITIPVGWKGVQFSVVPASIYSATIIGRLSPPPTSPFKPFLLQGLHLPIFVILRTTKLITDLASPRFPLSSFYSSSFVNWDEVCDGRGGVLPIPPLLCDPIHPPYDLYSHALICALSVNFTTSYFPPLVLTLSNNNYAQLW